MSQCMRKPTICIGENKGADQLRSNCEADQRLCFRYTDSTISLLLKSEISSFWPASVTAQPGLCQTWSEPQIVGFLMHRLKYFLRINVHQGTERKMHVASVLHFSCNCLSRTISKSMKTGAIEVHASHLGLFCLHREISSENEKKNRSHILYHYTTSYLGFANPNELTLKKKKKKKKKSL